MSCGVEEEEDESMAKRVHEGEVSQEGEDMLFKKIM